MAIVKRLVKGSALTHTELDGNFTDLDGRVTTLESAPGSDSQTLTLAGDDLTITGGNTVSLSTLSTEVVDDTSPQLGGNLDLNGNQITGSGGTAIKEELNALLLVGGNNGIVMRTTSGKITIGDQAGNVILGNSANSVEFVNDVDVDFTNTNIDFTNATITGLSIVQGIDDLSDVDTSTTPPGVGQVLKWDGAQWEPANDSSGSGGITLSALSVVSASASASPSLVYNNVTGVFTYTPPNLSELATDLDINGNDITGTGNINITGSITSTAVGTPTITSSTDIILSANSGSGIVNASGSKITNLGTPTAGTDAATKAYVDSNGGAPLAFVGISVDGQTQVLADGNADTLTFEAGAGMTITTDSSTDKIIFAQTGGATTWATLGDKNNANGPSIIALGINAGLTGQGAGGVGIGAEAGKTTQGVEATAVGTASGKTSQGENATAIGSYAGNISQGVSAVAIGDRAGSTSQGANTVAVGAFAGVNNQGTKAVAIGYEAGEVTQGLEAIAIGNEAGNSTQGTQAIALGSFAGFTNQGTKSVAVGMQSGEFYQGGGAVAVGLGGGGYIQGQQAVAIGDGAGGNVQGESSIAIGLAAGSGSKYQKTYVSHAGTNLELSDTTSLRVGAKISNTLGVTAGTEITAIVDGTNVTLNQGLTGTPAASGINFHQNGQETHTTAIGYRAGQFRQKTESVAIGRDSGYLDQAERAVALGINTGRLYQGLEAIAIGPSAGNSNQEKNTVAIGANAGRYTQGVNGVAIGYDAGEGETFGKSYVSGGFTDTSLVVGNVTDIEVDMKVTGTGFLPSDGVTVVSIDVPTNTVTISAQATEQPSGTIHFAIGQGDSAVAIGVDAGKTKQGNQTVAIGKTAGSSNQGLSAVAIGQGAAGVNQQPRAIAIGDTAGLSNQGANAIAIGANAGLINQAANSIVLNATGLELSNTQADAFVVKPIRNAGGTHALEYDPATGEVTYDTLGGGGSGLQSRGGVTGTTSSLADAAQADLDITGFKSYALLTITTDRAARVRLYVSAATRTADASRAEGVDPTSDAGLIAEVITTGAETVIISPGAYGFNLESSPTTNIPCRVTNKSGGTSTVQVDLNILQLEA